MPIRSIVIGLPLALFLVAVLGACRVPPLPEGVTRTEVAQGKYLYSANCASCHGRNGEGQDWRTPVPEGILPAPPHNSEGHTWHHPEQQLLQIIREGGQTEGSLMPAYKDRLTDEQIEAILAYIKTMWGPEEQARQAELTRLNMSDHK